MKRQSKKSVLAVRVVTVEEASLLIREYSRLLYPIGYRPMDKLLDPEYIKEMLVAMHPSRDRTYELLDTPEGRMYMMGFIAATTAVKEMQDEEEEEQYVSN